MWPSAARPRARMSRVRSATTSQGANRVAGVQVSLERGARLDPLHGLVQGDAPVHAHHVGPGLAEQAQELAGAHTEVDTGHLVVGQLTEDPRGVGQHRGAVVLGAQRADPGVEELDRAGPGLDLGAQEAQRDVGQAAHELVPQLGLAVHQGLGVLMVLRRPALDEVRGQRERSARETDERLVAELSHELADRLGDIGDVAGFEVAQAFDPAGVPDRLVDHGAHTRLDVQVDPDGLERHDDVAEEDRGVGVVPADRLHRDLGDHVGSRTRLKHRHVGANPSVLGQ